MPLGNGCPMVSTKEEEGAFIDRNPLVLANNLLMIATIVVAATTTLLLLPCLFVGAKRKD